MSIPHIPELYLRQVWQKQLFKTQGLHTSDRKSVQIITPGTPNTDSGPDFLNATIRIGGVTFYGDVELHQDAAEWVAHKHTEDPHYNRVILHVVMTADNVIAPARTQSYRPLPLLVLHPFFDDTLRKTLLQSMPDDRGSRSQTIKCYRANNEIPVDVISRWIEKLAQERIEFKVRRFEERLKQLIDEHNQTIREPYPRYYGNPADIPPPKRDYSRKDFTTKKLWEQLLYEGIMEAMGYSKNCIPFLTLGQTVRLDQLRQYNLKDTQSMMALLFGAAGLLPSTRTLQDKESRSYVRSLRRRSKELRHLLTSGSIHEGEWLFFRLRPNNFPTARLAAMCFLLPKLFGEGTFKHLIGVFNTHAMSGHERIQSLLALFSLQADPFWQRHYHFRGKTGNSGVVLGTSRIHDIVVNVIIPIVLLYARIFNDHTARGNARKALASLPSSQENNLTGKIQRELLKEKAVLDSALMQQGAIQLYKFYCSPIRCSECEVGRRVFQEAGQEKLQRG
jgi:hypothetical protein